MSNKDMVNALLKEARRQGCAVKYRTCGHWKITTPQGRVVFCSSTPSDARAIHQIRGDLRRAGVTV